MQRTEIISKAYDESITAFKTENNRYPRRLFKTTPQIEEYTAGITATLNHFNKTVDLRGLVDIVKTYGAKESDHGDSPYYKGVQTACRYLKTLGVSATYSNVKTEVPAYGQTATATAPQQTETPKTEEEQTETETPAPETEEETETEEEKTPEPTPAPVPQSRTVRPRKGFHKVSGWRKIECTDEYQPLLERGKVVCLWGPPGTGKTESLLHTAEDMGWESIVMTAPMFKTDFVGFRDVNSYWKQPEFIRAYTAPKDKPVLCIIDEIDRALAEALICMNTGIANKRMETPDGDVQMGEGFHLAFTANTNGDGNQNGTTTANPLDSSTKNRAVWFYVDYESVIDKDITDNKDVCEFIFNLRRAVQKRKTRGIVLSYRNTKDLAETLELYNEMGVKHALIKAIDRTVLKGLPKTLIQQLYDNLPETYKESEFAKALLECQNLPQYD